LKNGLPDGMRRRGLLRALIWTAPVAVLALFCGYLWVRQALLRSAVERAVAGLTGGSCSVSRARVREGRVFFADLEVRHPAGARLSCSAAVVPLGGWPLDPGATGRFDALDLRLELADLPPIAVDKLNVLRERDAASGRAVTTVMIASKCAGLNAALAERAGVRFEAGRLELYSRPELETGGLDFPVLVRLLDFKVRGTDGRFEVDAREARATVRVTGTRRAPRVDLGELEPYLGGGFVEGFRDLAP
jgi:hypothetical protein